MANRDFYKANTFGAGFVNMHGRWRPNAGGQPDPAFFFGGWFDTVTRTGAGAYTIHIPDTYVRLQTMRLQVCSFADLGCAVVRDFLFSGAGNVAIFVFTSNTGAPLDMISDDRNVIMMDAVFKNSSVTP